MGDAEEPRHALCRMDAGRAWSTLLATQGAVWVAPGSLVSGRFEGRWTGWHAAALDGRARTTWRPRPSGLARGEHLWLDGTIDATFANGPWTIAVDARADGALGLNGTVRTRGSTRDFADWPLDGQLTLAGSTTPVVHDGFRLVGLDFDAELRGSTGELSGEAVSPGRSARHKPRCRSTLAWPDQPELTLHAHATVDPDACRSTSGARCLALPRRPRRARIDFKRNDTVDASFSGDHIAVEAWTRRFGLGEPATGLVAVDGQVTGPLSKAGHRRARAWRPHPRRGTDTFTTVESRVRFADSVLTIEDGSSSRATAAISRCTAAGRRRATASTAPRRRMPSGSRSRRR